MNFKLRSQFAGEAVRSRFGLRLITYKAVLLLLFTSRATPQNCEANAQYFWDVSKGTDTRTQARAFANYACYSDVKFTSSADSTSAGFGIPGVGSINFGNQYGTATTVKHAFCDFENQNDDFKETVTSFVRTASPVVADLIKNCLNSKGLHVVALQGAAPEHVVVEFGFNSPTREVTSVPVHLSLLSRNSMKCDLTDFTVDGAGKTILCQRNSDHAVTIGVNARFAPAHPSFNIPEIRRLPPLIVLTSDRNTPDYCCKVGNDFDGKRSAYITRLPSADGMWTVNGGGPYHVGWWYDAPVAGTYDLYILYASPEPRPVEVHLEDYRRIEDPNAQQFDTILQTSLLFHALEAATGGPLQRKWSHEHQVELVKGRNFLWFHSAKPMPNIDAIKLIKEAD